LNQQVVPKVAETLRQSQHILVDLAEAVVTLHQVQLEV
jgi:hypothetical protein